MTLEEYYLYELELTGKIKDGMADKAMRRKAAREKHLRWLDESGLKRRLNRDRHRSNKASNGGGNGNA